MTDKEVMQMALDALEQITPDWRTPIDKHEQLNNSIEALRTALAQPEQEPVAWRTFDGEGCYEYRSYELNEDYDKEWLKRNTNYKGWVEPLYTAPPQRNWVGLTHSEQIDSRRHDPMETARVVEAKLNEKNNAS